MAETAASKTAKGPLAVYIHWPYCARICPYCDFNVHLDKRAGEAEALVDAIVEDLAMWREWTGAREIGSIHFGGGTPSLLTGAQLARLTQTVDDLWGVPSEAEIALEANPNNVTAAKIADWQGAGLNRLSLGVQSFDDDVLKRLGRDHDGGQAKDSVEACLAAFRSVSADLIFGVAGEGTHRLTRDLMALRSLGVPHISTYQLTVEPGTAFAKAQDRGETLVYDEDNSARDMERIGKTLRAAGYRHYEISNYAKPGHESRHNLAYWREQDYVGVGPGAHGRLCTAAGRIATETVKKPMDYITAGSGRVFKEPLTPVEAADEHVLMGLRIEDGFSLARLESIKGGPVNIHRGLFDDGYLERQGDRIKATPKGRLVLDTLTRSVLLDYLD